MSTAIAYSLPALQRALQARGLYKGKIDGIYGPGTEAAIVAFKKSQGFNARPYVGPETLRALGVTPLVGNSPPAQIAGAIVQPPWINEITKHMGMHEKRNLAALMSWLRSDKTTLGDPSKLPWCGDAVETALKLSLPSEPMPINPYLARNWMRFGESSAGVYGAVAVFWRGSKQGTSGHVCFAIGYDPVLKRIRCRGGNQGDSISDVWLDADRLLGFRVPSTWGQPFQPLPTMNSKGAVISTNEA